jgi:hypothetical protein
MSDTTEPSKRRTPIVRIIFIAFSMLVLFPFLFPLGCRSATLGEGAKRVQARNDTQQLVAALKAYQTEYGVMPSGNHAQIISALRHDNPKKIVFFEAPESRFSASGEFLDPWKSPYRIDVLSSSFPWAYSFGKNRIDEGGVQTADDIPSWR